MLLYPLLVTMLAASPSLVSAAIFPSDTQVKMLDTKGFRKAMKQNMTSVVAFVAPWCGHCQRMAPEYSKAAEALSPMVPLYAVDCDQASNKPLCAEQGVQGFPTVKLFPRGGQSKPISYESGQRTANSFFYWASHNIPHAVKRLEKVADVNGWIEQQYGRPRALLLSSGKDTPLMWKALGNKYKDQIAFAVMRDKSGKNAVKLGVEEKASKASKVLIYPSESSEFVRFEGRQKFSSLDKYMKTVADGTADFPIARQEVGKGQNLTFAEDMAQAVFDAAESPEVEVPAAMEPEDVSPVASPFPRDDFGAQAVQATTDVEAESMPLEDVAGAPDAEPSLAPADAAVQSDEVVEETIHAKDEL